MLCTTTLIEVASVNPMVLVHGRMMVRPDGSPHLTTLCDHGVPLGMDALRSPGCVQCAREELLHSNEVAELAQEWHEQILLEGGDR